jgi:hypothetical protein
VHVVVKNSPFTLTFGSPDGESTGIDLHKCVVDVKLLYDLEGDKEVDFVKDKPVLYKTSINQNGAKLTVEARIKVLTSQLEDSLFKIGVSLFDPTSQLVVQQLYSESIKVISKSDQVKQKKSTTRSKNKKSSNDNLTDALAQIEEKTDTHNRQLQELVDNGELLLAMRPQNIPTPEAPSVAVPDFQTAYKDFVRAYTDLTPENKRQKLQNALGSTDRQGFQEMLDLLWTEGLSRETGFPQRMQHMPMMHSPHSRTCDCLDCPYKKELLRVEGFYEDVFSLKP